MAMVYQMNQMMMMMVMVGLTKKRLLVEEPIPLMQMTIHSIAMAMESVM